MTEVFDELLVSLQSKTGTLRNGSSRRSRAVVKSSAPLSSASSATSPPGSGGPIGGGGGGLPIRRAGRQNAGEGLSLSEGDGRPKSDFGLLSTTTNSSSTARPSAGGLTVWDRNVSVTDLVHQFLGDPPPQPPAGDSINVENGWRPGVVKSASREQVAAPTAHSLSSALSPQLPMRTMKRAKALDPQRLREAERFALEALGASNDSFALYEVGGEFGGGGGGDGERKTREEERREKDREWEHLMQGLSANASRDGLDATAEVVGDDARQHQHQHQVHDRTRHHQAKVEEDDEEVKRKTATLEQLLAQLEVDAPDEDRHDTLSASSSLSSILIPDEEAAPATMVVGNTLQQHHHHHHHNHYRFGLPTSPGGQLRSVSSPALFGPAPTAQDRGVDMRLLNEQLNDGPMLPNDRDAIRLEQSAPSGTCARCHQPIPVGAPRLKALDRTYHAGCWVCNQCLRPLNTGAFFMLQGVPHCQYCTHKLTLPACHHCGDTIKDVPVRIGEQKWHRSCLQCMQCKKSLQFETCNDQHGVPLCSACAEPAACFYCSGCGKSIHGEIFVAMNKNWHEGCFACTVCRVPFEHTFYAGPDGRPYCSLHIRPSRSITS